MQKHRFSMVFDGFLHPSGGKNKTKNSRPREYPGAPPNGFERARQWAPSLACGFLSVFDFFFGGLGLCWAGFLGVRLGFWVRRVLGVSFLFCFVLMFFFLVLGFEFFWGHLMLSFWLVGIYLGSIRILIDPNVYILFWPTFHLSWCIFWGCVFVCRPFTSFTLFSVCFFGLLYWCVPETPKHVEIQEQVFKRCFRWWLKE